MQHPFGVPWQHPGQRESVVPAGASAHLLLLIYRAHDARIRPPAHLVHCLDSRDQLLYAYDFNGILLLLKDRKWGLFKKPGIIRPAQGLAIIDHN